MKTNARNGGRKSRSRCASSRSFQWMYLATCALLLTAAKAAIFKSSCWGGRRNRPLATTTKSSLLEESLSTKNASQKPKLPKKKKAPSKSPVRKMKPAARKRLVSAAEKKKKKEKEMAKTKKSHHVLPRWARRSWRRLTTPKNQYTPLVFFTAPKGMAPECDAMEKLISEVVEDELGLTVQRFDVVRDRHARVLFDSLDRQLGPENRLPLLFHRESFQSLYGMASSALLPQSPSVPTSATSVTSSPHDAMLVRAWAKGRWLFPLMDNLSSTMSGGRSNNKLAKDADAMGEDGGMGGEERPLTEEEMNMLENEGLTSLQRKGKEAMRRRMEEEAAAAAANK